MPYVETDMSKCKGAKAKISLTSSPTSAHPKVLEKTLVVEEPKSCALTVCGLTLTIAHQKFWLTTTCPFDTI